MDFFVSSIKVLSESKVHFFKALYQSQKGESDIFRTHVHQLFKDKIRLAHITYT